MTILSLNDRRPSTAQPAIYTPAAQHAPQRSGRSAIARFRAAVCSRADGGALVEVAVTMPILMIIMTGIFNYSIAIYQKLELTQAVGTGGRLLALERGDTDPCSKVKNAVVAAAPMLTSGNINLTFVMNGVTTGPSTSASCPGTGGTANPNLKAGQNAQVTATYPCNLNFYGKNFGSCNLQAQITEIVQ